MPTDSRYLIKTLYLMKIVLEQTDEDHAMNVFDMISALAEYEIICERKSVYSSIKLLQDFGIDLTMRREKGDVKYFVASRNFELPELKLLVDAVVASKFITKAKSEQLIKKIEELTSVHLAKQLQRQVYMSERVKAINEKIYYNVDIIHSAINKNSIIKFKYLEYNIDKKRQYRKNGENYVISPYALIWSDDNYYLIAYYDKYDNQLTHFRVDRMNDIVLTNERVIDIRKATGDENFNLAVYSRNIFGMYSGESEFVTIEFHNSLINVVIDRFSENVQLRKSDNNHFIVSVEVVASATFLGWLFGFGDKAKIIAPTHIVEQMKRMIMDVLGKY